MTSRNYQDLIVWQKAMDLVETIYRATRNFPVEETYGLRSQMRRAAVSVPSNIAEGQGRGGSRELIRFSQIAYGSLRELETQALISGRLHYLDDQQSKQILEAAGEVGRLLNGLIRSKSWSLRILMFLLPLPTAYCLLPTIGGHHG